MVLLGNVLCLFPTKISPLFEYVLKMSKERPRSPARKSVAKARFICLCSYRTGYFDQELGSCKNHTRSRDETRPRIERQRRPPSYRLPNSRERVEKLVPISELIESQDHYFIDQASELVGKIVCHLHPWLRREDANNDSTGSVQYSVLESETPPAEADLQEQVAQIALEYRNYFLEKNRRSQGTAAYHDEVPKLLRTMNSWSHGFATPNETGLELRQAAYAGWRDQDFAEVCRRVELVLEETRLSILLQEILLYGIEPQGLPMAVSRAAYGEFLFFLEDAAGKRRLRAEDPGHTQEDEVALKNLYKRISLVEAWCAEHAPVHFSLALIATFGFKEPWLKGLILKMIVPIDLKKKSA